MKTEIVPYEPIHAYTILDRNVREQEIWLSFYPDWEKWAVAWKEKGPGYTLIIDGEIIGCAGVTLTEWDKGIAWALLSSLFYKYRKTTFKAIKDGLKRIIRDHSLRRIESLVKVGFEPGCKMLLHLGFTNETPNGMKSYGPNGEDMYLFGRVC